MGSPTSGQPNLSRRCRPACCPDGGVIDLPRTWPGVCGRASSANEVTREVCIAEAIVETHVKHILRHPILRSRVQAVVYLTGCSVDAGLHRGGAIGISRTLQPVLQARGRFMPAILQA